MSDELLKRIEKLEDEVQDLTDNLNHVTKVVHILINKLKAKGMLFDNVS